MPSNLPPHPESSPLADLARVDRTLTREEVATVLNHVPLFVLADDEEAILKAVARIVTEGRQGIGSVVKLDGDIQQCFDALPKMEAGHLPIVLCHDGAQAETAARIVCERQIGESVLIFDQQMGFPKGFDVFMGLNGKFPPTTTRVLHSATLPQDIKECIEAGILDVTLAKPMNSAEMREKIAQAHLRRTLGASANIESK